MILYRAMCEAEALRSTGNGKPHFVSRYKWFSPSREFVNERVQDGAFNNSTFVTGRYAVMLRFVFSDESKEYFIIENEKEYRLDRRDSQMVKCEKVEADGE